jgi:hypothetical protein
MAGRGAIAFRGIYKAFKRVLNSDILLCLGLHVDLSNLNPNNSIPSKDTARHKNHEFITGLPCYRAHVPVISGFLTEFVVHSSAASIIR